MVARSSLIAYPDDVQTWDISLAELRAFGQTAAAVVDWACRGLTRAQVAVLEQVWQLGDQLAQRPADSRSGRLQMQGLLASPPGGRTGFGVEAFAVSSISWSVEFSVGDDLRSTGAQRLLPSKVRLGRFAGQPFIEYLIAQDIAGRPLTVRVHPSRDGGHPFNCPWLLGLANGRSQRPRLQGVDLAERDPIALVDNDWDSGRLVESVMAQLIDWHHRVANTNTQSPADLNCPAPAADALLWWIKWLQAISGNREIGLPEALPIAARRSVRPATPSGHEAYWRKSLKPRHRRALLEQACSLLGISRSTAYHRINSAGRRPAEFTSVNDLVSFLRDRAPQGRLSTDQRELIEALVAAGSKREAARKLEYRTRNLPEQERHEHLLRASNKLTRSNTR